MWTMIDLEEAWVQTQGLPSRTGGKGRPFSQQDRLPERPASARAGFCNGNLVYTALLGPHGVLDSGVQLSWQVHRCPFS
jgi:hypothetical protein